jgi:benzoate-CoA ligase family protein
MTDSVGRNEGVAEVARFPPPGENRHAAAIPVVDPVPWDSPGVREIGFSIPYRYNASEILFRNLADGREGRPAVIGPAGQRTYAQLCADAARWGNALLSLGLVRGDRVLFLLDDSPVYPAAFFGAIRAGLVPLLINFLVPPDLLRFFLIDSGAKVIVAEAAFCDRIGVESVAGTGLEALVVVNGEARPRLATTIRHADGWLWRFSERLEAADTHRDDMAYWMYSSGSTGRPKGVVHLQHDMPYTACSYGRHVLRLAPDDICFSVPKIFFSYGFSNSITFPFAAGATALLMPGHPNPATVFELIERYRPTIFFGLPTLYTILIHHPAIANTNFSSIRLAVSAAEVLPAEVANAWKSCTGLDVVECLGSTEVQNVYLSNTPERRRPGASGLRVPGYEIALKDQDGRDVRDGEEGVMWVRGHSNTPLYWNQPERTARTIRDGGWISTGDRFVRDRDGFYFFRGRTDDLVRVSGQWVRPIEVQICLAEHPAVRECAVLAAELPDRRTTLKAFVVLREPAAVAPVTARELQTFVKRRLLPYKSPRIVEFLDELPKTATGKIDRQALLARSRSPDVRPPSASPAE